MDIKVYVYVLYEYKRTGVINKIIYLMDFFYYCYIIHIINSKYTFYPNTVK